VASVPFDARVALADRIRASKQSVAEAVTEEFLRLHPDWLDRFGLRARTKGIEDALYHLSFLAGAIEAGSDRPFRDYVQWTVGVLQARGIASTFVAENLRQIENALLPFLSTVEQVVLSDIVRAGCESAAEGPAERSHDERDALTLPRSLFFQALLQGQRQPAVAVVLEALGAGHSILDIYADVLQVALYQVGSEWERNRITVAQEHVATAIAQYVLALLYERLTPGKSRRGRAIIAGVEGELHQVGPNMVADALEADGWDVRFLGTNMPHEGIVKIVREQKADVVGISATMLFNVPKVRSLVGELRQTGDGGPKIVVGGGAFRLAPDLYSEIGADGFAPGLREAITLLRELVPAAPP
jgi:MerR family transcriptional regulator, light-induced transcriptional regulator